MLKPEAYKCPRGRSPRMCNLGSRTREREQVSKNSQRDLLPAFKPETCLELAWTLLDKQALHMSAMTDPNPLTLQCAPGHPMHAAPTCLKAEVCH